MLGSISRLMSALASPEHQRAASRLGDALATFNSSADLMSIGAYQPGANASLAGGALSSPAAGPIAPDPVR